MEKEIHRINWHHKRVKRLKEHMCLGYKIPEIWPVTSMTMSRGGDDQNAEYVTL